jgi:hypothetical protein
MLLNATKFLPKKIGKKFLKKKSLFVALMGKHSPCRKICVFPNETDNTVLAWYKTRDLCYENLFGIFIQAPLK